MSIARYFTKDDFSGCSLPFETPKTYKIYHDGRHLIATRCFRSQVVVSETVAERRAEKRVRSALDIQFDDLFLRAYNKGLRDRKIEKPRAYNKGLRDRKIEKPMSEYIRSGLSSLFTEEEIVEADVAERIKRKLNNLHHRIKRFRRKAYLNRWNYFVTVTYFYGHYF